MYIQSIQLIFQQLCIDSSTCELLFHNYIFLYRIIFSVLYIFFIIILKFQNLIGEFYNNEMDLFSTIFILSYLKISQLAHRYHHKIRLNQTVRQCIKNLFNCFQSKFEHFNVIVP